MHTPTTSVGKVKRHTEGLRVRTKTLHTTTKGSKSRKKLASMLKAGRRQAKAAYGSARLANVKKLHAAVN